MRSQAMRSQLWGPDRAQNYDSPDDPMFSEEVLKPTVDFLAGYAGEGAALEFAIGTGRVGVPLLRRGVPVHGIELSEPMVSVLRTKVSADKLPVTIGDMSTTTVAGEFSLVFLVFNTISNLLTQEAQVDCFHNAAAHLKPGGYFVVELGIPPLRHLVPTQTAVPFEVSKRHVGLDTFDLVTQRETSHHFTQTPNGDYRYVNSEHRYIWPSEMDLMAQLAGMHLVGRFADFTGAEFTGESTSAVSVWQVPER